MALNLGGLRSDLSWKDPANSTEAVCKLFTSFNEWKQEDKTNICVINYVFKQIKTIS